MTFLRDCHPIFHLFPGADILILPFYGNAIKFHPVVNQTKTELFRDLLLQQFQFRIDKFNDIAGFNVNQMVMMGFGCGLIAGAAITKIMAFQYASILEQTNRAIDGGNGNAGVNRRRTFMQLFYVGMVIGFGENLGDHAPLFRNAKTFFGA